MASIDLDKRRSGAARPTIRWRGRDWSVRTGVPLSVLQMSDERDPTKSVADDITDLVGLIAAMLEVTVDDIVALDPDHEELGQVMAAIDELLGLSGPGGSSASSGSRAAGATRSRPTSAASTASASKRPATTRRTSPA